MAAIVYLNGRYLPEHEALVSVNDRGFVFADGVYEVVRAFDGRLFALREHLDRLRDSLAAIRLVCAIDPLADVSRELLSRNQLRDARLYWQITRGAAPRNHLFPAAVSPTIFASASPDVPLAALSPIPAAAVLLHEDRRWRDCAVKSLMLLPNVLAKQAAADAGCEEAVLVRDGLITEGSSTSFFAVIDGVIRTHPTDGSILPGVTRSLVLQLASGRGLPVRELAVTPAELADADELFLTVTTRGMTAITRCGGHEYPVGAITRTLHAALLDQIRAGG